jgi:O-antigen/teichoic acid export membrane protein
MMKRTFVSLLKDIPGTLLKGKTVTAKAARGSIWLGGATGFEYGLRFVRNVILTRVLAPEAFGVMAIVLGINAAFESFTEIGVKEAVIQNPRGEKDTYLNGAWWLSVTRSTALYILAFLIAPSISQFYNSPELVPLMHLAFLSIILKGAISARAYVAIKQMDFRSWVIIYHGGAVCGILAAIGLAFAIENVWALVIGFTVEAGARLLLSYIVSPYRPRIRFNKEDLRALFKFARGMLGLPILAFIFLRADVFVVGKIRSYADLGLYSMAVTLAFITSELMTKLINEVAMPAFSLIQSEKDKINKAILQITSTIALIWLPALAFVGLYSEDVLTIVYGAQYAVVALPFSIVFFTGLLSVNDSVISTAYFGMGRPELHRIFAGLRAIVIVTLIYPAVKWLGLIGAALAGCSAMSMGYLFEIIWFSRLTGLSLRDYCSVFLRPLGVSLCVLFVWATVGKLDVLNVATSSIMKIIPGILGCLLSYGLGILLLFRSKRSEFFLRAGMLTGGNLNSK